MVVLCIMKAMVLLNLAGVTLAGVVVKSGLVARSCNPEPPVVAESGDVYLQLVNNATSLFAWQFAATIQDVGSQSDTSSLTNIIQHMHPHIDELVPHANAIGANGEVLTKLLVPRFGCGINVDPETNINHIVKYTRLVLQTELNIIFAQRSTGFTALCDNWDLGRLQTVYGTKENAGALYNWVCAGSNTGKPTKSVTSTSVPAAITNDFVNSISTIFAWELLGTLMNSEQVKTACTKDWDAFSANIKKTGMNSDEVKKVLCTSDNQNSLPNSSTTADIIKRKIQILASHALIVQLFALSGESVYQDFLCSSGNYELGNFNVLGLDKADFYEGIRYHCAGLKH